MAHIDNKTRAIDKSSLRGARSREPSEVGFDTDHELCVSFGVQERGAKDKAAILVSMT